MLCFCLQLPTALLQLYSSLPPFPCPFVLFQETTDENAEENSRPASPGGAAPAESGGEVGVERADKGEAEKDEEEGEEGENGNDNDHSLTAQVGL